LTLATHFHIVIRDKVYAEASKGVFALSLPRIDHPLSDISQTFPRVAPAQISALEALRWPASFTSDLEEEKADILDLCGMEPGQHRPSMGANGGPNPLGTRSPPPGSPAIKSPIDIMRDRNARESRRKTEAEALDLQKKYAYQEDRELQRLHQRLAETGFAEEKPRLQDDSVAAHDHLRDTDLASTADQSPPTRPYQARVESDYSDVLAEPVPRQDTMATSGAGHGGGQDSADSPATRPTIGNVPRYQTGPLARPALINKQSETAVPISHEHFGNEQADVRHGTNSFPHAFERWETLSAHWEGLTSFWIRRLEQSQEEWAHIPLEAQLARQVTDLSAAGANLFHAVVELQRLRASSERKFQRWFHESRRDAESKAELNAMMKKQLEQQNKDRAQILAEGKMLWMAEAAAHITKATSTGTASSSDKTHAELKKELAISKEEARRAWEELGRMEHNERMRTKALQKGEMIVVGGITVVPVAPQYASTQPSTAAARHANYAPQAVNVDSREHDPRNMHALGAASAKNTSPQHVTTPVFQAFDDAATPRYYQPFPASQALQESHRDRSSGRYSQTGSGSGSEEYVLTSGMPSVYSPQTARPREADSTSAGVAVQSPVPHDYQSRLSEIVEEDDRSKLSANRDPRAI
jgi:hypothetical protein